MAAGRSNSTRPASSTPDKETEQAADAEGTRVEELQFPSLEGHPDVEVAKRSADVDKESSTYHEKVFVVPSEDFGQLPEKMHEANITAMRNAMIQQGLRTEHEVEYVGSETAPDGESVELRYRVRAVPAAVADPEESHMTVPENEQE